MGTVLFGSCCFAWRAGTVLFGPIFCYDRFMKTFFILLLFFNTVVFCLYGADKRRARHGRYRIPERGLLLLAFFGGAAGTLLGMLAFHHKTRKNRFMILVPLFLILQILTGVILFYRPL